MSNLARTRKEKHLSQNNLVKMSGVSRSLITKYESGEKNINKAAGETLFKIATALHCKIEDLLEGKEKIMEDVLFNAYSQWRKEIEEENKWQEEYGGSIPVYGSVDCGEASVREDFSNYARLEEEISLAEMLELEKRYEAK